MTSTFLAIRIRPANVKLRRADLDGELPVPWLLAERPDGKDAPTDYWISNLPAETPFELSESSTRDPPRRARPPYAPTSSLWFIMRTQSPNEADATRSSVVWPPAPTRSTACRLSLDRADALASGSRRPAGSLNERRCDHGRRVARSVRARRSEVAWTARVAGGRGTGRRGGRRAAAPVSRRGYSIDHHKACIASPRPQPVR